MKQKQEIKNFRELIKIAERKKPEHIVYKFKKDITSKEPEYIEITYTQFKKDIEALATNLLKKGLNGKRIALVGNNCYAWCVSYLAITTANMVVVPLDRALPEQELEKLILRSEASAVIFENKHEETIKKMAQEKESKLELLINIEKDFEKTLQEGKELLEKGDTNYQEQEIDENKMAIMLFTSGTTNEPKAVMLSQNNICSNIVSLSDYVKLYPKDTLLSFLPIHHTFECTITFLFGLYCGTTVAFCDGLRYIAQNLKEYQISVFVAVPLVLETMYKKIQKGIEEKGKTKLIEKMIKISNKLLTCKIDLRKILFKQIIDNFGGNLRIVLYGAAPMSKDTIIGYNNLGIESLQGYGLTETSPVISAETYNKKRPGSVGLPLTNLKCKIENPNKEGIGEVLVKGPSIMLGYYNNEEETKKVIKDGWFYTGDYGYIDQDGFLFITGRKKDIIVLKNGKNVYPQEIEFLINKIPYIIESLVYQREESKTDTMLCAKIIYDKERIEETLGKKEEEEYKKVIWQQIKEINKNLPIYKHIKKIEITTTPLAKTTTQKVKRYVELQKVRQ